MSRHTVSSARTLAMKNRTAMSCDRCKRRKTKCNNPVPGPCDYCVSIGAVCQIDTHKRKQRPYYFVSEDEFRYMSRILRHCFPDRPLDLADLNALSNELDLNGTNDTEGSISGSFALLSADSDSGLSRTPTEQQTRPSTPNNELVFEEIVSLHEDLGCLMKDSRGRYRYIGADSGISFNAAVRYLNPDSLAAKTDKDVIPGMKTTIMPPATSESSPGHPVHPSEIRLPAKEICLEFVARFFEEVHSLYWLYSTEQFYKRLEHTYNTSEPVSASWMCSLYSILALGSQKPLNIRKGLDSTDSFDYLAMAESLVSRVCDEADLESIRAQILLALALQSHCFSNTAYLHTGTACRIAFSLGLHMDKYTSSGGPVEKEYSRCIYYTLYIFEQEVALRSGKPSAIAPSIAIWEPPLPSEQVCGFRNTLSGYLEVSLHLTRLTKTTCQTLYVEPFSGKTKLLSSQVAAILSSLQEWANIVPAHLRRTAHMASSDKRSISLLYVRYWSVVILATRPFLLSTVLRKDHLQSHQKKICYERLSYICLDAATHSLEVLQLLANERLLTSLVPSVFNYVLELVQIFIVGIAREHCELYADNLRACVCILKSMDDIGWTSRARPEVMVQLRECGIFVEDERPNFMTVSQDSATFLTGEASSRDNCKPIFGFEPTDAGNQGYESLTLTDMDFGDTLISEEFYQ